MKPCDKITRSLSAGADPAGPELAPHLAACERCADWAESITALDAAWSATRPAEPPAQLFDQIWSRIDAQPTRLPFPAGPSRAALRRLAAAASILVGLGLAWLWGLSRANPRQPDPRTSPPLATTPAVAYQFEAEPGETLFLHITPDGRVEADIRDPATTSETITVAAEFEILNFMESQAADAL
ncbi:MAG: hypothetical protein KatS3mg108_3580 [Isosphaeraceae bacterium]|jgi:hypothetical protein|nr:MAG: hypothetical protein KatS3mg108_3580 [Isosphaeraceae bacterium]